MCLTVPVSSSNSVHAPGYVTQSQRILGIVEAPCQLLQCVLSCNLYASITRSAVANRSFGGELLQSLQLSNRHPDLLKFASVNLPGKIEEKGNQNTKLSKSAAP